MAYVMNKFLYILLLWNLTKIGVAHTLDLQESADTVVRIAENQDNNNHEVAPEIVAKDTNAKTNNADSNAEQNTKEKKTESTLPTLEEIIPPAVKLEAPVQEEELPINGDIVQEDLANINENQKAEDIALKAGILDSGDEFNYEEFKDELENGQVPSEDDKEIKDTHLLLDDHIDTLPLKEEEKLNEMNLDSSLHADPLEKVHKSEESIDYYESTAKSKRQNSFQQRRGNKETADVNSSKDPYEKETDYQVPPRINKRPSKERPHHMENRDNSNNNSYNNNNNNSYNNNNTSYNNNHDSYNNNKYNDIMPQDKGENAYNLDELELETLLAKECPEYASRLSRNVYFSQVPFWVETLVQQPPVWQIFQYGVYSCYVQHKDSVFDMWQILSDWLLIFSNAVKELVSEFQDRYPTACQSISVILALMVACRLLFGKFIPICSRTRKTSGETVSTSEIVQSLLKTPQMQSLFMHVKKPATSGPSGSGQEILERLDSWVATQQTQQRVQQNQFISQTQQLSEAIEQQSRFAIFIAQILRHIASNEQAPLPQYPVMEDPPLAVQSSVNLAAAAQNIFDMVSPRGIIPSSGGYLPDHQLDQARECTSYNSTKALNNQFGDSTTTFSQESGIQASNLNNEYPHDENNMVKRDTSNVTDSNDDESQNTRENLHAFEKNTLENHSHPFGNHPQPDMQIRDNFSHFEKPQNREKPYPFEQPPPQMRENFPPFENAQAVRETSHPFENPQIVRESAHPFENPQIVRESAHPFENPQKAVRESSHPFEKPPGGQGFETTSQMCENPPAFEKTQNRSSAQIAERPQSFDSSFTESAIPADVKADALPPQNSMIYQQHAQGDFHQTNGVLPNSVQPAYPFAAPFPADMNAPPPMPANSTNARHRRERKEPPKVQAATNPFGFSAPSKPIEF